MAFIGTIWVRSGLDECDDFDELPEPDDCADLDGFAELAEGACAGALGQAGIRSRLNGGKPIVSIVA